MYVANSINNKWLQEVLGMYIFNFTTTPKIVPVEGIIPKAEETADWNDKYEGWWKVIR